jgi:hypothetical protein
LIKTAEIAHRRSVKANEKLESVRDELSKVWLEYQTHAGHACSYIPTTW